jgi:hypothetical protein
MRLRVSMALAPFNRECAFHLKADASVRLV